MKLVEKLKNFFNKSKQKPLLTLNPFVYREGNKEYIVPGRYFPKTNEIEVVLGQKNDRVLTFKFKPEEWEKVKDFFDEKSKKEIEKFIKIVMKSSKVSKEV
jgi:hypothetical protein